MSQLRKKDAEIARLTVENWNLKYEVGQPVKLRLDIGEERITRTRYKAYVCDAGYAVCFFEGVSGYYMLDRAEPIDEPQQLGVIKTQHHALAQAQRLWGDNASAHDRTEKGAGTPRYGRFNVNSGTLAICDGKGKVNIYGNGNTWDEAFEDAKTRYKYWENKESQDDN